MIKRKPVPRAEYTYELCSSGNSSRHEASYASNDGREPTHPDPIYLATIDSGVREDNWTSTASEQTSLEAHDPGSQHIGDTQAQLLIQPEEFSRHKLPSRWLQKRPRKSSTSVIECSQIEDENSNETTRDDDDSVKDEKRRFLNDFRMNLRRLWIECPPRQEWRKMLILWTFFTWCICVGSLVSLKYQGTTGNGLVRVRSISCKKQPYWQALALSLPLNILGTLLVAASQFTRQVLMSPTRRRLDRAHQKSRYLTVGLPSIRNLIDMNIFNIISWILLVISSLVFHVL